VTKLTHHICPKTSVRFNGALADRCIKSYLDELEVKGFTIVEEIFTKDEIKQLQEDYLKIKERAQYIIDNIPPLPREWEESGVVTRSQYWKTDTELMLEAGVGRHDLYKGFSRGFLAHPNVRNNPVISKILKEILVSAYNTYQGVILSAPNSGTQYWHRDTDTLQNRGTCGKQMVQLDDFYFTVVMPCLVDVTMENGPTQFYAGSHRQSADEYDENSLEYACAPLGSAILWNGKINHRGTSNQSSTDRPMIYQVWHKMWYNDNYRAGVDDDVQITYAN